MDSSKLLKTNEYESNILTGYWNQVSEFLSHYGWYLFGLGLLLLCLKPYIEDALDKMQRKREAKEFEAKCKKDPNLLELQRQAIERARRKMQEEQDNKAATHMANMKKKEEKKLEERLSQESTGNILGTGNETSSKKKTFKPEYNPLMGSGSQGYRPTRRSGCPGGGCG